MNFNPRLPPGCKIIPFRKEHALLMQHNEFQRVYFSHIPDYLERLEHMSSIGMAFTILKSGVTMVCAGLIPLFPNTSEAWMLRDERVERYPIALSKGALVFFDEVGPALDLTRVQLLVNAQNIAAVRWAKWLKFKNEGRLRAYGPDDTDYYMFARLY